MPLLVQGIVSGSVFPNAYCFAWFAVLPSISPNRRLSTALTLGFCCLLFGRCRGLVEILDTCL